MPKTIPETTPKSLISSVRRQRGQARAGEVVSALWKGLGGQNEDILRSADSAMVKGGPKLVRQVVMLLIEPLKDQTQQISVRLAALEALHRVSRLDSAYAKEVTSPLFRATEALDEGYLRRVAERLVGQLMFRRFEYTG